MTEDEIYLFDLNGYIKLEGVLTPDQVDLGNRAIDHHLETGICTMSERPPEQSLSGGSPEMAGSSRRKHLQGPPCVEWKRPWCDPFREMLSHPRVTPFLECLAGSGFRADTLPGLMATDPGAEGHTLHNGGGEGLNVGFAYSYMNDRISAGMISVEYLLADEGPDDGGFAVVPGSHKANLPCPRGMLKWQIHREHIRKVPAKAGDAVIFSEAATHGALPWRGNHQRRVMLIRFVPGFMAFHGMPQSYSDPAYMDDLSEPQKASLRIPGHRQSGGNAMQSTVRSIIDRSNE
jgi:hypothetical protein